MSLAHLIRQARALPPRLALAKAAQRGWRWLGANLAGLRARGRDPYPDPAEAGGRLARRLGPLDRAQLEPMRPVLAELATLYRAHRFDLLGSGWVRVAPGERYPGFGPWRYGPEPVEPGNWKDNVVAGLWPGAGPRARAILGQIEDDAYVPIDWRVDFKSGYRWPPRVPGPATAYGHEPGVDVKVPWELGRLQHLAALALAFALDPDPELPREFEHQVRDFLGANPPGWGVQWASAMEAAIRIANILLARDLFRAAGADFDDDFETELACAALAHGRFVVAHLGRDATVRANHYLADVVGLLFAAAYLPRAPEPDAWLAFAVGELGREIERQFGPDGGNFEASTAYHRFAAEMAIYGTALALGLPDDKRRALAGTDPFLSSAARARLGFALRFAADVVKPSGEAAQIGDNDSGRLFKLTPLFDLLPLGPRERHLDFSHLRMAFETGLVAGLAGGASLPAPERPPARPCDPAPAAAETDAARAVRVRVLAPDPAALAGLEPVAYPDFGLFIWRNARAFVSVRCGPIGQNGLGGHAHNDQLAVEIELDGVPFARDPGAFVYTPDPDARNAYRSALAHFVPREGGREPARLLAPFRLEDRARAQALAFDGVSFLGVHYGFGAPVFRRVTVAGGAVTVEDLHGGGRIGPATALAEHVVRSPEELRVLWNLRLPFSSGYGIR